MTSGASQAPKRLSGDSKCGVLAADSNRSFAELTAATARRDAAQVVPNPGCSARNSRDSGGGVAGGATKLTPIRAQDSHSPPVEKIPRLGKCAAELFRSACPAAEAREVRAVRWLGEPKERRRER